mgnify:FL=1
MSDRDLILLAAGGAIGMMSAFQMVFVLALLEKWLASRRGSSPEQQEIGFRQPSRASMRCWDMIGVLASVLFLLTSFQAAIAIRDSLRW